MAGVRGFGSVVDNDDEHADVMEDVGWRMGRMGRDDVDGAWIHKPRQRSMDDVIIHPVRGVTHGTMDGALHLHCVASQYSTAQHRIAPCTA